MIAPKHRVWLIGLLVALAVAMLSPLASSHPDGLERVAEDQGFLQRAHEPPFALIPEYALPGMGNEALATMLAGISGTLLVAGVSWGLARLVRRTGARA